MAFPLRETGSHSKVFSRGVKCLTCFKRTSLSSVLSTDCVGGRWSREDAKTDEMQADLLESICTNQIRDVGSDQDERNTVDEQ